MGADAKKSSGSVPFPVTPALGLLMPTAAKSVPSAGIVATDSCLNVAAPHLRRSFLRWRSPRNTAVVSVVMWQVSSESELVSARKRRREMSDDARSVHANAVALAVQLLEQRLPLLVCGYDVAVAFQLNAGAAKKTTIKLTTKYLTRCRP